MFEIIISERVILKLQKYSLDYREYFCNVYQDCGIWSEDQIIDCYDKEGKFRPKEILKILKNHFSKEFIL
jgi:hypothetical protein